MLHHFTKSTIHIGDQLGSPLPCIGKCRRNTKIFIEILNFTVGNAQKHCVSNLSKCKVNPLSGDGQIDAKWMDGKHSVESACLGLRNDKCLRNQDNSNFNEGQQSTSIFQHVKKCGKY